MLYIPVKHLKPGMVLAKDLPSDSFIFSLLTAGYPLTEKIITKLKSRGIQGAYIESEFCSDATADELIDPKLKQEILITLKQQFDDYVCHSFTPSLYESMTHIASDLVSHILSKDNFLLNMIDIRDYDNYTYSHSMFVGLVSVLIGIRLGLEEDVLNDLAMCGLLHDIGKLDIPIEIISKPSELSLKEYIKIQEHPANAVERLRKLYTFSFSILNGVESHHEKFDGTGYPNKLSGANIPFYGRVLALADVYDALSSERPYRSAWSPSQAIEYMMGLADTHFDYELLQVFLNVIACYPTGTIVELSNGFICVVIKNTPGQTLRPIVRVLSPNEFKNLDIDLSKNTYYLNTTIINTISDHNDLPQDIFMP